MIRRAHRTSIANALALALSVAASADEMKISLQAQPLALAIQAVARQTSTNILVDPKLVAGLDAPALDAQLTVEQAIARLLQGTGLTSQFVDEKTIVVMQATPAGSTPVAKPTTQATGSDSFRLAQAESPTTAASQDEPPRTTDPAPRSRDTASKGQEIEEVLVTGTLIHRADPLSPVITITHDDMVKRGYTRLDRVIEQLPQNFKDGASPESSPNSGHGAGAAFNASRASGINLRGFGANATLVLLNGQRMSTANFGDSVDISMLPVSIIERVEILTDGASAIYGADAVAGVVNIITRNDFSGAEFGARMTSISEGKAPNYGGYVLGGHNWSSGNLIFNYDYEKDAPLFARSREVTATAGDPNSVLPKQEITSVYSALRQRINDLLSFSADVRSARREYDIFATNAVDGYRANYYGRSKQSSVGSELKFEAAQWHASVAGHYAAEEGLTNYLGQPADGENSLLEETLDNRDTGFDARVDGPLFQYSAGTARVAFGATYRAEKFRQAAVDIAPAPSSDTLARGRHARSAFGEVLVPLLNEDSGVALVKALTLDIAGRYDDYSDFGSTFNPKFALKWGLPGGLAMHGVYGRSFRTPTLFETIPGVQNGAYIIDVPDPLAAAGQSRVLIYQRPNPELQAERSRSINLGLAYASESMPELQADLSYFDVKFTNKIVQPLRRGFFTNVLTDEAQLGALVARNPTLEEVNAILNEPGQEVFDLNESPFTPDQIQAIANLGYINAAVDHPKGLDASLRHGHTSPLGHFSYGVSGTYYINYDTQIAPDTPPFSGIEKTYLPTRWRGQATLAWDRGGWSAYSRINYTSAYHTHTDADPACPAGEGCAIPGWTTVDAGVALTTNPTDSGGLLAGLRLGVDVSNVFSREAPYVFRCFGCYNYDSTNANPLERAVSITLTKEF